MRRSSRNPLSSGLGVSSIPRVPVNVRCLGRCIQSQSPQFGSRCFVQAPALRKEKELETC